MTTKHFSLDDLFSFHSLISASFIVLLIAHILRNTKFSSIVHSFLFNVKFVWISVRLYLKYLPKGNDGLFHSAFLEINKLQPTPFKINNFLIPAIYIDKPADIQIILNNPNSLEKADIYKFIGKVIGRSLFGSEVSIWKPHRRLISQSFHTRMLEGFFHIFNRRSQEAVKKLQKLADANKTIDLWDHFSVMSFDTLCETMFGMNGDAIFTDSEKRRFQDCIENFSRIMANRVLQVWLHPDIIFKPLAKFKGWDKTEHELIEAAKKVVNHKKLLIIEEVEKINPRKESICSITSDQDEIGGIFLSNLLEANDAGLFEIADDDVTQEVLFMMIAGIETTGLTMCYTMLMLAINPQVQEEIYKEIIDVMGTGDERLISFEDVERMELLDRCIKETLRLFPIVPILARDTTADIKLSDGQIAEKGTMVVIAPYLLHRNPELYEDPLVWNPDHFLPEIVEKRHAYSYIAFSAGPRGCLGTRYATLSMRVTLAKVLKKFRVTTDMKIDDIKLKFDFIVRSVEGYKVKLHTRV